MKKFITSLFIALLFIAGNYGASFSEPAKLAIAPFTVEAESGIDHLSKGIVDLFSSRLGFPDKVIVVDKQTVMDSMGEIEKVTPDIAREVGKKINADYILYGFILEAAKGVAIKAYVIDLNSDAQPVVFTEKSSKYETIDLLLPFVNRISAKINRDVFSREIPEETRTEDQPEQLNIHAHPDKLLKLLKGSEEKKED